MPHFLLHTANQALAATKNSPVNTDGSNLPTHNVRLQKVVREGDMIANITCNPYLNIASQ